MNKKELQAECEKQEIDFTEEMTKAQLKVLLENKETDSEEEIVHTESDEVVTAEEVANDLGVTLTEDSEDGINVKISENNSMHISEEVLEAIVKDDIVKMAELIVDPEFEKQVKHKMDLDDEEYEQVKAKILEEAKTILESREDDRIHLKLRKPHPSQVMRLGRHQITAVFAPYELNEAELKELQGKGCKAWIISKSELEAAKK